MLSASISNAEEIAAWIEETRNKECRIVIKKDRPVELRFGFLHPKFGVIPLSDEKGHLSPEVSHFYGSLSLDESGTRVTGRFDRSNGRGERRGRSSGGREQRGGASRGRGRGQ